MQHHLMPRHTVQRTGSMMTPTNYFLLMMSQKVIVLQIKHLTLLDVLTCMTVTNFKYQQFKYSPVSAFNILYMAEVVKRLAATCCHCTQLTIYLH